MTTGLRKRKFGMNILEYADFPKLAKRWAVRL